MSVQAGRPPLHVAARPGVVNVLRRHVQASQPRSFCVVGLPGFHSKELFESVVGPAVANPPAGVTIERLRIDRRRPESSKALVQDYTEILGRVLGRSVSGHYLDLEKEVAATGRKLILVIGELEGLRLTEADPDGHRKDVEGLLDAWQVACTEGPLWLSVWACSHLEPAAICEAASWSPFHKVFGLKIEKVGALDSDSARAWLESELAHNVAPAEVASAIVTASGGVPEVCEALAARVEHDTRADDVAGMLSSISLEDMGARLDRWLSTEQRQLLCRLAESCAEERPEDRHATRPLIRLGAVREAEGKVHLNLPLGLVPATTSASARSDAVPFIRGLHLVPDLDRPLIAKLCVGHHFVDLEVLQHREGEARVLLAHPESKDGEKHRPFIVKVHKKDVIKKEVDATRAASSILGSACPKILGHDSQRSLGAYAAEFMTADSRGYKVWTYQDVFRGSRPEAAVSMIERVLGNVLGALYRTASVKPRPANRFYRIPKPEEYEALERRQQECIDVGLGRRDGEALELLGVRVRPCHELFRDHRKALFDSPIPLAMCDHVHGDLNPRNFLMDAADNVCVIDYSTFAEGPICEDFARIEVETIGKLLEASGPPEQHGGFLASLLDGNLVASARRMARLPLKPPYGVTARAVEAVRTALAGYHQALGPGYDGERAYLLALAGTCVRMALFSQYLSPVQQASALLYTGLCMSRLIERP